MKDDEYELWQFHAHWGKESTRGSEHTLNGESFAAELHLVHWNRSKYSSPGEACEKPDGLAVLGRFLKIDNENPDKGLEKVLHYLDKIKYCGDKADLKGDLDPTSLLPKKNKAYWTYEGSLTTPPLLECVIWLVLKDKMSVSEAQVRIKRGQLENLV